MRTRAYLTGEASALAGPEGASVVLCYGWYQSWLGGDHSAGIGRRNAWASRVWVLCVGALLPDK